jgi:PAS domain S-box-containing protein
LPQGPKEAQPSVLIVAEQDPEVSLGRTALFRDGLRRRWFQAAEGVLEGARESRPRLVVVDLPATASERLVRELRADPETRSTAIAAVNRGGALEAERALDAAGASVVLPHPLRPELWNARLEELLRVPGRRGSRIPVRASVWSRISDRDPVVDGVALNISVRGMLLETAQPIEVQTRADLSFELAEDTRPIRTVGQVVRASHLGDRHRLGIEFQILRGDARSRISAFVAATKGRPEIPSEIFSSPDRAWEAELRASEARKAAILDSALDGILTFDQEGRVRECNAAAERMFGVDGVAVLGRKVVDGMLPAALRDEIDRMLDQVARTGRSPGPTRIETTAHRIDGAPFPIEASISPAYAKGRLLVSAYVRDVSERKRAETALRESEARHRAVSELAWDYAYSFRVSEDGEQHLEWVAGAFTSITGYSIGELGTSIDWSRFAHPDDRGLVRERIRALVEGRDQVTDYRIVTKQGRVRWVRDHARPTQEGGRVVRIAGATLDVTDSKHADLRLRDQEKWLRALFENSTDGLSLVDANRRILYRGPANRGILGFLDEETGPQHLERVHPSDRRIVENAFDRALRQPRVPITLECRSRHKDGSWRWLEVVYKNLIDVPEVGAVVVNFRDISARKDREQEERRLQASIEAAAQHWRETVDSLDSAVLIVDADGAIVRGNRAARDLAGVSFSELKGRQLDAVAGEPWAALGTLAREAIAEGTTAVGEVRDPGSGTYWSLTANPVAGAGGEGPQAVLLARDATGVMELQERVRRSELMSAMGSLVAGVAHEVRSPLFGITATIDAYARRHGEREENRPFLATLRRELDRMSHLMEELLTYGRPTDEPRSPGQLGHVIAEAVDACRNAAREAGVDLVVNLSGELPSVAINSRLVQVFQNLILNAVQHSPAGGHVFVEAEAAPPWGAECRVSDEGPGFSDEDLEHLFDPFYTRRRGGTGLGLSIVRRIVEEHAGAIQPGSRPGGGALMTVHLPAFREEDQE